jgi:ArsR family metal-binding transcriptional regulator
MRLSFSDGITIDTSGPLRIKRLSDGLYVVGEGTMIPVEDEEEAQQIIEDSKRRIREDHK